MLKRSVPCLKLRAEKDWPISGYGFLFSEISQDGVYGREQFSKNLKLNFAKKVFLLRDHDPTKILAKRHQFILKKDGTQKKSKSNLEIVLDNAGLKFWAETLPNTSLANETKELIKEGLIDGCSVGFEDVQSDIIDGIRTYKEIRLHEISIVPSPYFESGQVSARHDKKITYPPECLL